MYPKKFNTNAEQYLKNCCKESKDGKLCLSDALEALAIKELEVKREMNHPFTNVDIQQRVEEYILSPIFYLRKDIDAYVCASELRLSEAVFRDFIHKSFGEVDLVKLARELKIEYAKDLLSAKKSIRFTSRKCNYRSCLQFILDFKKVTSFFPWTWIRMMVA